MVSCLLTAERVQVMNNRHSFIRSLSSAFLLCVVRGDRSRRGNADYRDILSILVLSFRFFLQHNTPVDFWSTFSKIWMPFTLTVLFLSANVYSLVHSFFAYVFLFFVVCYGPLSHYLYIFPFLYMHLSRHLFWIKFTRGISFIFHCVYVAHSRYMYIYIHIYSRYCSFFGFGYECLSFIRTPSIHYGQYMYRCTHIYRSIFFFLFFCY